MLELNREDRMRAEQIRTIYRNATPGMLKMSFGF